MDLQKALILKSLSFVSNNNSNSNVVVFLNTNFFFRKSKIVIGLHNQQIKLK